MKLLFLTVCPLFSKLIFSKSQKTVLSYSVDVRLEHRESECIVYGSFVAFALDPS